MANQHPHISSLDHHPDISRFSDGVGETVRGQGRVEVSVGLENKTLFDDTLAFREDFVTDIMHWFERPHNDKDRYDDNLTTLHLGSYDHEDGELIASLRLTPVGSLSESLTLSMLNENNARKLGSEMIGDVTVLDYLYDLSQNGTLEDLTRLASRMPKTKEDVIHTVGAMMELFGVAAGSVRNRVGMEKAQEVRWLFATTESMCNELARMGVQMHVILAGDFDDEKTEVEEKSYLCLVDQEQAIGHIFANPDTLASSLSNLTNGLRKANAL